MKPLILVGRLIFGAWMLTNGANHFFFSLWPTPTGHEPLAIQLMAALVHSGLFDVAMTIQLVTGALILTGFFVPAALCVVMPISTCALYWALILDHQPLGAVAAAAAFALNALLMLAYLDYYREVLQAHAVALTESPERGMCFDFLFANPNGRTPRSQFLPALITLLAVLAFYAFRVTGLTAHWCMLMLVFPAVVLHARRLHDMGQSSLASARSGDPGVGCLRRLAALGQFRCPAQHRCSAGCARDLRQLRPLGLHWPGAGRSQSFRHDLTDACLRAERQVLRRVMEFTSLPVQAGQHCAMNWRGAFWIAMVAVGLMARLARVAIATVASCRWPGCTRPSHCKQPWMQRFRSPMGVGH